jgi:plastocyanin
MPTRRHLLVGVAAALLAPRRARGADAVEIAMAGRDDGAHVWYDPIGVLVRPGQTVRWTNREKGNVHTTTAYHPANSDRPLRLPQGALPWDSDYLMPGDSFEVALTVPGVYDYYCVPHEHAGMVGRIVVGEPGLEDGDRPAGDMPEIALKAFPPVTAILRQGVVRRS